MQAHLEPHSTWHQLGGAGASHRVAAHLTPCSAAASGLSSPPGAAGLDPRLCLHSSRVPCSQTTSSATGTLQCHSGQTHSLALQPQPPAPLSDASSLSHCIETSQCHSSKCCFSGLGGLLCSIYKQTGLL